MQLNAFIQYLREHGCLVTPWISPFEFRAVNPANSHSSLFPRTNPVSYGRVKLVCEELSIPVPPQQDYSVQQGNTTITYHSDDVLPEIKLANADNASPLSQTLTSYPEESNELGDISGCIALIGPIQVCYSADLQNLVFELSLKVGPVTVVKGEISAAHPCISFNGSYGIAKWDLEICLNLDQRSITLSGKACAFGSCKSFNITIFHW